MIFFIRVYLKFLISLVVMQFFSVVVKPECTGIAAANKPIHVEKRETLKTGKKLLANDIQIHEAFTNSPEITTIASKLVAKLPSESEPSCTREVNKVLNATTQIVTGKLFALTMEVCFQNCAEHSVNECEICTSKVWQKPWEGRFDVREFQCNDANATITSKVKSFEFDLFH